MRLITKLWTTLLLLCVAGVASAATEYEVDQRFTSISDLDGKSFAIVDETPTTPTAMGIGITGHGQGWDMYFGTITEAYNSNACFYKLEAVTTEGLEGYYYLRTYKADGNMYTAWGNTTTMGYFNSQFADKSCCFALGLEGRNGQDGTNLAIWAIEESEGKFALKNIGTGLYLHADNLPAKYEDAFYFTFCSLKEKAQTDPLADQKDALNAAIAKGKMINAIAYTEATFAALTTAVTDGETALASTEATATSLTNATNAITNAIEALALKEGYTNLTKDIYKLWNSNLNPTEGSETGCAYTLFESTGQPYGDGSVQYLRFADISEYSKLILTVADGTPRIMMNRLEPLPEGTEGRDANGGAFVEIKDAPVDGVVVVDLTQYDYAHLNAIKGANWANVTVTGMFLYKAPAETPAEYTAIDWVAADHYTADTDVNGTEIALDGKTSVTFAKNSGTNAKYYANGEAVRVYKNSTITFKGEGITKIILTYAPSNTGTITANIGEYNLDGTTGTWKGNANEVVLTNDADAGQARITKIHIVYGGVEPDVEPVHIANTAETAYTVTQAIELIDAGEALDETVFVKGIVSKVDEYNDQYKNITYWISADGTTDGAQFECYRGKGIDGADFAAIEDVEVGAEVIVTGKLAKYNDTYELAAGNALVSYKAPFHAPIADGKYYLYSVAAEGYVVGANNWGTRASISKLGGIEFEAVLTNEKYELKSAPTYANSHLGTDGYVDNAKAAQKDWTIVPVEGQEGVFTLATNDGKVLFWDGGEATTTTVGAMPETAANAYWKFVTKAEREALFANATDEAPADATFYIVNPDFGRASNKAVWQGDDYSIGGGNDVNNNAEKWGGNSQTFDVHQTVTVPDGKYKLVWNGFYRYNNTNDNTNDVAASAHAAGTEVINSVVYVNDTIVPLTSIADEAAVALNGAMPFSQAEAAAAFAKGAYEQSIEITVISGSLTIGVKKTNHEGTDWTIWDNFRLFYTGAVPADAYKPAYETALKAAQDALADEANAVIAGEEKTALEKAISDYTTVDDNADAYKAATAALNAATLTFTSAKKAYEGLAAAKAEKAEFDFTAYPYAAADKKTAAEATLTATATSAADATAKTEAITKAFRQYAESSAMLEGIASINYTDSIKNPAAEEAIDAKVWNTVLGEGSGGEINILSNEPWTDAAGVAAHKYFDGGNWGAQAWDVTLQQEITLPAGRYLLTAKMRASNDVEQSLFAGENSTTGLSVGATGGLFDRGWNDASVEFELEKDSTITIGVRGVTEKQYNWMSFSDFRLVQFPKPELILTLHAPVGEEVTLTFGVYNAEDKFTVDFGGEDNTQTAKVGIDNKGPKKEDGTTASATKFTGTVGGDGTIKVYGINDIWYYNTYGNVLPTTFDQPKLMNVVQMSITGADVESITLPAYPKMEQFSFNNSSMKSVDVTNVPTLTSLTINSATASKFEPQLESIDLSKNTELTYLSLQGNTKASGKLTTLDLTNNTKLNGMGLFVQYNQLTEVKLPECGLTTINVQNNKLTAIDLTKVQSLKSLYASNNQLEGEIDLSAHTNMEYVQVNNNQLTSVKVGNATKQFYVDGNKLTLATIPAQPAGLNTTSKTKQFHYAPQAALEVAETVSELDLTSQLTVAKGELNPEAVGEAAAYTTWFENQTTTFSFVTAGGTTLVEGTDYEVVEPGKFKFLKAQEEKVHAVMLNAAFPKFTETAPFTTTEFTVEAAAEEVLDPDLVEIPQDQGKTLDDFARTELVEGEKYNTYTCTEGIQVAFKMFDIDVKNCDYVVVKFAEPVAAGWELAFWGKNDQSTVAVPAGATEYKYVFAEDAKCAIVDDVLPQICMLHLWTGTTPLVAKVKGVYKHKLPITRWDFTQWSEATITNLKAEAAKGYTEGLWSDAEKADGTAVTMEISKNNCFWQVGTSAAEGETLTANGEEIAELQGLLFKNNKARSLAIAVNYGDCTSANGENFGPYHGASYLWLGSKNIEYFTIPAVKAGSIIKMGVESHKFDDARGVKLLVNGTELNDPDGNAVAAPKTYTEQYWQVPAGDDAVDVVVKNTNGCHIYFIDLNAAEEYQTSISTVKSNNMLNGTIYNLNGQKVNKAQKGLYIINGKKVVIK